MNLLQEYDVVKVVKLLNPDRKFDGTDDISRPPRIGDIGTICHDYDPGNQDSVVAVEMVTKDGMTVWLADFKREELELVQK